MKRPLTAKGSVLVLVASIVFAFLPVIVIICGTFLGVLDMAPVSGGMSEVDGIFLYMFVTLPIGLLVGIWSLVNLLVQLFGGKR